MELKWEDFEVGDILSYRDDLTQLILSKKEDAVYNYKFLVLSCSKEFSHDYGTFRGKTSIFHHIPCFSRKIGKSSFNQNIIKVLYEKSF